MKKQMQVSIQIDTDYDTPNMVKDLIVGLMREAGDRTFAIESVTIDGEENFKIGVGFMNTLSKKQAD